jgi:DTW domain-containing protein YfiP
MSKFDDLDNPKSLIQFWGVRCVRCDAPFITHAGVHNSRCPTCMKQQRILLNSKHYHWRVKGEFLNIVDARKWLDQSNRERFIRKALSQ